LHEITVTVQSDIFWSGRNLLATAIPWRWKQYIPPKYW
jgi:hypothetical protein